MAHSISEEKHFFIVFNEFFNENQHCKSEECSYTLSHTAEWCGTPQERFCECAFCYSEGTAEMLNWDMKRTVSQIRG